MQFFINEILESDAVRAVLRSDPAMAQEGRQIARRITEGENITPPMGLLPLFVLAYLADYALEKNTARGIERFMEVMQPKVVIPMHCQNDAALPEGFAAAHENVIAMTVRGQTAEI